MGLKHGVVFGMSKANIGVVQIEGVSKTSRLNRSTFQKLCRELSPEK